jgi:hypothetical protein
MPTEWDISKRVQKLAEENPWVVILGAVLVVTLYEYRKDRTDFMTLCSIVHAQPIWSDDPVTRKQKINDLCLGSDPADADYPQEP